MDSLRTRICFENKFFVAADKPEGWLTVPSRFEREDERTVLGRELEKELNTRLYPVHRLDFEVSGLVLFAKDASSHRLANDWFSGKVVRKTYQALSGRRDFSHWPADLAKADEPLTPEGIHTWKCRILRGKRRSYEHPKGDPAVTEASYTESGDDLQWTLAPITGRSHQLRFELSRHGFPIHGDALYGSRAQWASGIALRSVKLDFSAVPEAQRKGLPEFLNVKGLFA